MRGYEDLIEYIASAARAVIDEKGRAVFAIDGRCASGKTTAAQEISKSLPCTVFHADDFFLRPEQRTPERYAAPGGNFDRERFLNEVLLPAVSGETVNYRPFDCKSMKILEPQIIHPEKIIIVEGAYCCHPVLWDCYDKRFSLRCRPKIRYRASAKETAIWLRRLLTDGFRWRNGILRNIISRKGAIRFS